MSGGKLVMRRARLVRVREVQHTMAVAETVRAHDDANSIANNAQRLSKVRDELFKSDTNILGKNFAAYREMADRLERAGRQLEGALYDARKVINHKQEKQVEASRAAQGSGGGAGRGATRGAHQRRPTA